METVEERTPNCWQQKAEDQKVLNINKVLIITEFRGSTLNSNSSDNIQNLSKPTRWRGRGKTFLKSISRFFLVIDVVVVSCDPLLLTVHQDFCWGNLYIYMAASQRIVHILLLSSVSSSSSIICICICSEFCRMCIGSVFSVTLSGSVFISSFLWVFVCSFW